ncbi:unnamed protein product [Vitrella brassicaformis CCMP3155]|uniref:Methyltransferase type 11 domain-containing protein n=1 Tax=Vitrella brassicaformis (strain CCMP3155) TaxID=1169540 RepID=A0A0G4EDV9_VITBC|nr:unnamed protein product [Vitrella brassicaformis CCMP3155]|eukprot:CEL93733.1 unnamed protein product [Vitrella brassicaformis CCMP3155]
MAHHFAKAGFNSHAYASTRPTYPQQLYETILGFIRQAGGQTRLAIDVGCGNGQVTTRLAHGFDDVIGIDASQSQLDHAAAHPRVKYHVGAAESLPASDGSVDLVTAAQAAHWFDLPAFFRECRRVLRPTGVVAVWTYENAYFDNPDASAHFSAFFHSLPWDWRRIELVDKRYTTIPFDQHFDTVKRHEFTLKRETDIETLRAYISTWSAVHECNDREAGRGDALCDAVYEKVRKAMGVKTGETDGFKFMLYHRCTLVLLADAKKMHEGP